MNPPSLPEGLDPLALQRVLAAVKAQVAAALWLSGGMACAVAGIAALAIGWRRTALVFGLSYSVTLCFVPNGHAQVLGPLGTASALAGLLRPRAKGRRVDR